MSMPRWFARLLFSLTHYCHFCAKRSENPDYRSGEKCMHHTRGRHATT